MKTILILGGAAAILLFGGVFWTQSLQASDPQVISRTGIHWHPTIAIYIKGVQQEIPADIGVGPQFAGTPGYDPQMKMAALHTHDDLPIVHLEFMDGPVRIADATVGQFFTMWGKDMRSLGASVRMTVNGKESAEFENYVMRDGDKIELHYD